METMLVTSKPMGNCIPEMLGALKLGYTVVIYQEHDAISHVSTIIMGKPNTIKSRISKFLKHWL